MSDQPKKRPWIQFHLSTAVILMFLASGLLWLNMRPPVAERVSSNEPQMIFIHVTWPGWPIAKEGLFSLSNDSALGENTTPDDTIRLWLSKQDCGPFGEGASAPINMACALCVLLAAGVICEWFIRRKHTAA